MLRRLTALCVVALLVFALVRPALAADRLVWRHDDGHFENTAGNSWVEVSPDGTFHFREVYRGETYVELYDASRDCSVQLTDDRSYVKFGSGDYQLLYYGYWER